MPSDNYTVVLKDPLRVQIAIIDPKTGDTLLVLGERYMSPGETISWSYPTDGIQLAMS